MFSSQITEVRIALLALSLLTLAGIAPWSLEHLAYRAEAFQNGQFWRPFTAWMTQLNWRHWLLNQWGVLIMLLLLPKQLRYWQWLGYAVMWLLTSWALADSDYSSYVGLSGVLYGWLIWSAYLSPYYAPWVKVVFIAALSIKVFSENGYLPLPHSEWVADFIQSRVAHESHLWGLLSGFAVIVAAACGSLFQLMRRPRG